MRPAPVWPASAPESIRLAAEIIRNGGLVAFPTETVYGLGCDARNPDAVARAFEAKRQPSFDPLIVHRRPDAGPSGGPSADSRSRCPNRRAKRQSVRLCESNLRATSTRWARRARRPDSRRGPCPIGVESAIVFMGGAEPELLRPGSVTITEIRDVVGPVVHAAVGHTVAAPGQLPRHYATRTPMTILAAQGSSAVVPRHERAGLLALSASSHIDDRLCAIDVLSASGDLREAARNLFAALRRLDALGLDRLYAEPCDEQGLGLAIMDRLRRYAVSNLP